MQPQGHMQLVRSLVDYRLDPQAAVDIPRWCVKGPGATKTAEDTKYSHVLLEDGFGEDTAGKAVGENKVAVALKERGHTVGEMVTKNTRTVYGRAQVIMKDPITGVLWAGSEPRSDGCAIPTL